MCTCVFWCLLRQRAQANGFSPVCHLPHSACPFSCTLQCPGSEKPFPHTEQMKGFSPVCIRSWRMSPVACHRQSRSKISWLCGSPLQELACRPGWTNLRTQP
uniref:Secreted protein n=1 Tax=Gadus morhua TaxID=8049 RepID=A0A8C5C4A5_GADMO